MITNDEKIYRIAAGDAGIVVLDECGRVEPMPPGWSSNWKATINSFFMEIELGQHPGITVEEYEADCLKEWEERYAALNDE